MANLIFRGDAVPVAQVVKLIPINPEVGDTFTIKINGKQVDFVATDNLVSTVVDGLVNAWNAAAFPEASQITAQSIDEDGDGVNEALELTADNPGVPFRLETSTSDAGGFAVLVTTLQDGTPDVNEIQRVMIPETASGGTFTLTFSGQTTAAIAFDASASAVQTALESLSNVVVGDISVTGNPGEWSVEFQGAYAASNVPLMTGDGSSLTGVADVSITTTTDGTGTTNHITQINMNNLSQNKRWRVHDPITSQQYDMSVYAPSSEAVIQSAWNAAMSTLGSGGVATVQRLQVGTIHVEFSGTWSGYAVSLTLIPFDASPPVITTIREGSFIGDNEVQRVALLHGPTGGTFSLTFNGQTTAGMAYNAAASVVESTLEALSTIGSGNVSVTGSAGGPWDVEFVSSLGSQDVSEMTADGSSLAGGAVTILTTRTSVSGQNEIQQISIFPPPAGGTFTLTIDPGGGDETTGAIPYDAAASVVQSAIEALASFSSGDVVVSGDASGPWTVEFQTGYAETDMNSFSGDGSSLTGGGTEGLILLTSTRSKGPNHFDDPDNWTGEVVPNSLDSLFFNGGKGHCLYGLKQRTTFTADATTDVITFVELTDFVEGQAVRLFTMDTLPGGLSTGLTHYIKNLDFDAGTCQLSLTAGGAAIDITDAGTGIHTVALHLTAIKFHTRWTGNLGLTERNEADYYEYLPRSLAIVVDTITIGEGEGDGQSRLDLDTGNEPTTLIVHQSGGSNEAGLPAIRWKGVNSANAIVIHDGEFGAAVYATEQATIDTLVQHAGLVQMGTVTMGSLTKHGGELIAEDATLAGALKLHA